MNQYFPVKIFLTEYSWLVVAVLLKAPLLAVVWKYKFSLEYGKCHATLTNGEHASEVTHIWTGLFNKCVNEQKWGK